MQRFLRHRSVLNSRRFWGFFSFFPSFSGVWTKSKITPADHLTFCWGSFLCSHRFPGVRAPVKEPSVETRKHYRAEISNQLKRSAFLFSFLFFFLKPVILHMATRTQQNSAHTSVDLISDGHKHCL